jgi:hypothetical protein
MTTLKLGQKFNSKFTSPFGKVIENIITIVCIKGDSILMDNGKTYHRTQLTF